VVLLACALATSGCAAPSVLGASSGWEEIAPGPLAPRHDAIGGWTGEELVVVGGRTDPPCPPNADCVLRAPTRDAAAYDPDTDTWRELPAAPVAVADGEAVWTGSELVVVSGEHTLAFDPDGDTWRRLDDNPVRGVVRQLVTTPAGVVAVAYEQQERQQQVDWRLDPVTGDWSPLPRDPFGESYDRSMVWDGESLWLLSMAAEHHFGAYEGAESRVAVLDEGGWTVVDEATPEMTYEQRWWRLGGTFVAPSPSDGNPSWTFDSRTRAWDRLPGPDGDGCPLPAAGAGPAWVSGGGPLLTSADATLDVPACPSLESPDVAVWAGDRLLVWGGPARDYRENTGDGFVWTPPAT
jgi:hypothetical protein